MKTPARSCLLMAVLVAAVLPVPARAGQPLETETARFLKPGGFEVEGGLEYQTSTAGTESAVPLAVEYGITDRLGILVEPVPFTGIHDKGLRRRSGIGDVEVTVDALAIRERSSSPALAVAGEAKIPTAKDRRIGSGKVDFTFYLIGSKRLGRWDTHLNLGYGFIGKPPGAQVNNIEVYALAEEFHWTSRWDLVAEVFGSTAALEGGDSGTVSGESSLTPEIGGAETVGSLGVRFKPIAGTTYTLGLTYDNNNAFQVHPGVTLSW